MNYKRLFYNFLQKKGAYKQYKHNRHVTNHTPSAFGYRRHFNTPEDFIRLAFQWDVTPEGYNFWCTLHDLWSMLIFTIKIKK